MILCTSRPPTLLAAGAKGAQDDRVVVELVRTGTNRNVLLVGRFAIKFPKLWPPRRTRKALKANRYEARFYREHRDQYPELCPVLRALPFGLVTVMARARIMTPEEYEAFLDSADYPDHRYCPYEGKPDEWGFVNGHRVVVDYAMKVHEDEFTEQRVADASETPKK